MSPCQTEAENVDFQQTLPNAVGMQCTDHAVLLGDLEAAPKTDCVSDV